MSAAIGKKAAPVTKQVQCAHVSKTFCWFASGRAQWAGPRLRWRRKQMQRTERVAKVFCSMCTVCSEITLVAGMSTPVL